MTRDHRRLAAIVSADVVGYSRLMGRDESATLAALKAHRRELIDPKIAEYDGRIVKTTGDGLLLEFPSVVDAVRCSVDVLRGMATRNAGTVLERRLEFRIGINVGDIIIDDGDIFGDGVNVAARLQTLAEPGGICASRAVRDHVLDKLSFTFDGLGAYSVKNIARPVDVYRIRNEETVDPSRRMRLPALQALRIDGDFVPALVAVATSIDQELTNDLELDDARFEQARDELDRVTGRAVRIDANDASTWAIRAISLVWHGRPEEGLAANAKAQILYPSDANVVNDGAFVALAANRPEEALALAEKAVNLERGAMHEEASTIRMVCMTNMMIGRYSAAISACEPPRPCRIGGSIMRGSSPVMRSKATWPRQAGRRRRSTNCRRSSRSTSSSGPTPPRPARPTFGVPRHTSIPDCAKRECPTGSQGRSSMLCRMRPKSVLSM